MLDPRIYRTGLIVAALALVVLGFSVRNQQGALSPTIAPSVFNGQNVYNEMAQIAQQDPTRLPGSAGDEALAVQVRNRFGQDGFSPTTDTFSGRTVYGTRTLENVVGSRPGIENGSIVVVASRDASGAGAMASASATATLLELAHDLEGETLQHTIVLASTSGAEGTAGALRLASSLSPPIDAVVVLGDLAGSRVRQPIVIPWSSGQGVAPPILRNTVSAAVSAQTPLNDAFTSLGGQFAHLAFPFTLGQQAPFGARGIPAVELSLSGERGPGPNAPVTGPAQVTSVGRAVLATVSALDSRAAIAAPSAYLLLGGKVVPGWAIALFGLALLVPVAMTTVDGVARARRRGHAILRSVMLVLGAALPFAAAVLVVVIARLLGAIGVAPPGPVAPGTVPLHGGGTAVLILAALAMLGTGAGVLLMVRRGPSSGGASRGRSLERSTDGAVAALLVVMCALTFAVWLDNPFAALLLVPALHLWMWAVNPDLRLPLAARLALLLVGIAPAVLVVLYYANGFGYSPIGILWEAALLIAGHGVSLLAAIEWSVALGCLLSVATLAVLATRGSRVAAVPVTVRGPVTYAGPGSLGGTKSALRR